MENGPVGPPGEPHRAGRKPETVLSFSAT